MIKIAIQKSGRLYDDSLKILKKCGISIDNGKDQLKAAARNFPLEVIYLRNGDIPQYLMDGVVDLAIIGENLVFEKGENLKIVEKLGFSKCKVCIAVPKDSRDNNTRNFLIMSFSEIKSKLICVEQVLCIISNPLLPTLGI